jgi:site-specific recombinase XerD
LLKTNDHTYGPRQYFLEGQKGGHYTTSGIRAVLEQSCKLASIGKAVTPHTLRHSYATHLMENGTGIRYIQELLGHSKPETTMIYTDVSSHNISGVVSPLDLMVSRFRIPEKSLDELSFGRTQFPNNRNKM